MLCELHMDDSYSVWMLVTIHIPYDPQVNKKLNSTSVLLYASQHSRLKSTFKVPKVTVLLWCMTIGQTFPMNTSLVN